MQHTIGNLHLQDMACNLVCYKIRAQCQDSHQGPSASHRAVHEPGRVQRGEAARRLLGDPHPRHPLQVFQPSVQRVQQAAALPPVACAE